MVFDKFKKLFQFVNFLVYFQLDLELILVSDVFDYGVGVVFFYQMVDGVECLIGYVLRLLNKVECGYFIIEKEVLVIIFGVKKFNQFLYGQKFIIQIDYKLLEEFFNEKKEVF